MERIDIHKYTIPLTPFETVDAFGDMIEVIYKHKKKEAEEEMFQVYEDIDKVNNSNWNDEDKRMGIWYIKASLTSNQRMLLKSVKELERLRNMYRNMKRNNTTTMPVIPLDEIKRIAILDVFEFKKVKKTGLRTMVSCPLHSDTNPSALINTNNTFKCFSCGFAGDVIALTQKVYGFDFVTAVRRLQGLKK